jgi:hypothetical protein
MGAVFLDGNLYTEKLQEVKVDFVADLRNRVQEASLRINCVTGDKLHQNTKKFISETSKFKLVLPQNMFCKPK